MANKLKNINLIHLIVISQFITTLDFILVMPMGPDITEDLGIPLSQAGLLSSAYAIAAAICLIVFSPKLDKFERRSALVLSTIGLSLSAFATAMTTGLYSLLIARMVAGIFGGLTSSFAMALVIDTTPPQRRGRAMGQVAGAFSLAAVLGIPAGLQLSLWYDWQFAFQILGILGLITACLLWFGIPGMSDHKPAKGKVSSETPFNINTLLALICIAAGILSGFLLIPHLAGYLQFNLNYDRELIGQLYMAGGIATWLITRMTGYMVDQFGSLLSNSIGSLGFIAAIAAFFLMPGIFPVTVVFVVFMSFNAIRTVSTQTLLMHVPAPDQRAGFMALQNATRHIATGVAAAVSSAILFQQPSGALGNTNSLGWLAIILAVSLPAFIWLLTIRLRTRNQSPIQTQTI